MDTEKILEELYLLKHEALKSALENQNFLLKELETLQLKINYNNQRIKNAEKAVQDLDLIYLNRKSEMDITRCLAIEPDVKDIHDSEIEEALNHKSVSPEASIILPGGPKIIRRGLNLMTREEAEAIEALQIPTQNDDISEILSFHD